MLVRIRLFAILRERMGSDSIRLELPEGATVRQALAALARNAAIGDLVATLPVVMAVNRRYAAEDAPLDDGDELALIPPVSGGDETAKATILDEPLSLERLVERVRRPSAGAIVTFQGVTREVELLDYEAYREMAEERIAAIVADVVQQRGLEAAAAEHRLGKVPLGEASVIVAVAAAHRAEAFAGAREIIDRIKAEAPIWKRELEWAETQAARGPAPVGKWVQGQAPPTVDRIES